MGAPELGPLRRGERALTDPGAHGEDRTTVTLAPPLPAEHGPIYFNSAVLPDRSLTETSDDGGVLFIQVPPGEYKLICWLPSWREADHERDGDTCLICRLTFGPPVEVVQPLVLGNDETKAVRLTVSAELFGK